MSAGEVHDRTGACADAKKAGLGWFRLYRVLASASIRAKMQYKFDFIGSTVIQAVTGLYDFFLVAVILWKFRTVAGWDIYEIGLLYSISRLAWGLYRVFCDEIDQFERYIVAGEFDSVLVRPYPSLFVLASRNLNLSRLGWVVQGIGVLSASVVKLVRTSKLSLAAVSYLPVAVAATTCLFLAIGVATSSAAFWIVRVEELQVFTENASGTATLYPLDIYPNWLKRMLLWVLPLGAGNYVPLRYLLGKGGSAADLLVPVLASVVALWGALRLWRIGESRYHSTGS